MSLHNSTFPKHLFRQRCWTWIVLLGCYWYDNKLVSLPGTLLHALDLWCALLVPDVGGPIPSLTLQALMVSVHSLELMAINYWFSGYSLRFSRYSHTSSDRTTPFIQCQVSFLVTSWRLVTLFTLNVLLTEGRTFSSSPSYSEIDGRWSTKTKNLPSSLKLLNKTHDVPACLVFKSHSHFLLAS